LTASVRRAPKPRGSFALASDGVGALLAIVPHTRTISQCPNRAEASVKQLIAFLLDHAMIDFSGDLTLDSIKDFLRGDDSPEARALMAKLVADRGVEEMMVTLSDCLQEYLRTGLTEDVVREQIKLYAES
jgi:hypothetical protein